VSYALMTDRYELTMLQAALRSGKSERECVFEVFTRQLPSGRRYGVLAGVGRVLDAIADFRFGQDELDYLRKAEVVDEETLEWLKNYKFSGSITGYREGEIYFANSPVMTVRGTFAEAVLLETVILSILNYDSAVAQRHPACTLPPQVAFSPKWERGEPMSRPLLPPQERHL